MGLILGLIRLKMYSKTAEIRPVDISLLLFQLGYFGQSASMTFGIAELSS